ncbi:MAG: glutamine amidotransferase [Roseibacillus sp.]
MMKEGLQSWLGDFDWAPVWGGGAAIALGVVAALLALVFALMSRNLRPGFGRFLVGGLRALFCLSLVFLLWNPVQEKEVGKESGTTVFLLDRSGSMALGEESRLEEAKEWAVGVSSDLDKVSVLSFAEDCRSEELEAIEEGGGPTRLAAALRRAGEEAGKDGQIVVVSDGCGHDQRDLPTVLTELGSRGTKVFGKVVGEDVPIGNAWLEDVRVSRTAKPGQKVPVQLTVGVDGLQDRWAMLRLRDAAQEIVYEEEVSLDAGKSVFAFEMEAGLRSETWELSLEEVEDERMMEDNRVSFSLEIKDPKLKVLYIEGTHAMRLVTSEEKSGWWNECEVKTRAWDAAGDIDWALYTPLSQFAREENLHRVKGFAEGRFIFDQARGFPKTREELFQYDVVICGDIPRGNFSPEQMSWLVELVTNRGGGFCMIGGYTSFDSGEYDQTPIEKITPVDILYHGYGYNNGMMAMMIPETVRDHPIWRISDDAALNETILKQHPPFTGYHDIQRAKPGATILGVREDGEGPLIAVQSYGKGRSMAFLSDTNGGWARSYVTWQNPSSSAFTEGRHQELGRGAQILYQAQEFEGMGPADTPHPCEYVGRFWVNVVRWLGEKSQRLEERGLLGRSEMVVVEPGGRIKLSAEVLAAIDPASLPDVRVSASLVGLPTRSDLRWDRERREFVGELVVPEELKGSVVDVLLSARTSEREFSDQLRLGLLKIDPELRDTAPNEKLMEDLTRATGGELLFSSVAAGGILREARREVEAARVAFRQPVWVRWDVFLLLVGLLAAEWLFRRVFAK